MFRAISSTVSLVFERRKQAWFSRFSSRSCLNVFPVCFFRIRDRVYTSIFREAAKEEREAER